eukprot:65746-Chlamydomonas_euryale.AAC.6
MQQGCSTSATGPQHVHNRVAAHRQLASNPRDDEERPHNGPRQDHAHRNRTTNTTTAPYTQRQDAHRNRTTHTAAEPCTQRQRTIHVAAGRKATGTKERS